MIGDLNRLGIVANGGDVAFVPYSDYILIPWILKCSPLC